MTTKFNLFAIITIPMAIWLGATDRISWWVIVFIFLVPCQCHVTLRTPISDRRRKKEMQDLRDNIEEMRRQWAPEQKGTTDEA